MKKLLFVAVNSKKGITYPDERKLVDGTFAPKNASKIVDLINDTSNLKSELNWQVKIPEDVGCYQVVVEYQGEMKKNTT